ncbi:MAG: AraC family transcriptional regulator [Lachnospiraceae bacterium]
MIQCFVKRNFQSQFMENTTPRLLSASNIHLDYAHHTRILHKHDDIFELLFVRSGSGEYIIENQYYNLKKGDIVICNSGTLHDEVLKEDDTICSYALAIDQIHLEGLPENHLIPQDVSPIISAAEYFETFNVTLRSIFDLLVSNGKDVEETCHHLMMSVLSLTLKLIKEKATVEKSTVTEDSTLGMRIRKYIDSHYMEDLSLQSIGDEFRINFYYLSHLFKKEMGYSPMQYVLRRRIGEAQTILITTNRSITDIASSVGFNNPNNFNIQFTKYVGLSPRTYRRTYTQLESK